VKSGESTRHATTESCVAYEDAIEAI
jgi:hypothetical protein